MKKITLENIPDFTYKRLAKQKDEDGYKNKSWLEWITAKASPALQVTDAEGIRNSTRGSLQKLWGTNMGINICDYIRRKNMKSLRDLAVPETKRCLVVGGGPSIEIHQQIETLAAADRKDLTIITCDRMLIPLLQQGIIPQYVVTVDGSDIILKFYKHPLVKKHIHEMKFIIHIAVNPVVTKYLYRYKADVYWFLAHQVYMKDEDVENSDAIVTIAMTATKWHPKGVQTIVAAGNVGVCAWATAMIILKQQEIGIIGFDMGYPEGYPLEETYYYSSFIDATQKRFGKTPFAALTAQIPYMKIYNPALKCTTVLDMVFQTYRSMFLELLSITPQGAETWNLTEGGSLFHPKLKYATLKQWIEKTA